MRVRAAGAAMLATVVLATSACVPPLVGRFGGGGSGESGSTDSSDAPSAPPSIRAVPTRCDQPDGSDEFERVDPAEAALDATAVADAVFYGTARGAQSVRVYRGDCLIATSGMDPETEWVPLASWSMTKGMVSLVTGRAVTLGLLDVDDTIGEHLPGVDDDHAGITVRQLLNQTSGLRFAWANDLNDAVLDSVGRLLERPFEAEPDTTWLYAQTTMTLLTTVVAAAAGEDFQAFAAREVFEPLGIPHSEWRWGRDGAGNTQGFAFLDLSPRSYGRIGSLLLNEGSWNGVQLIDPGYVRDARTGTVLNPAYGYLWWANGSDRIVTAGFPSQQHLDHGWVPAAPADAFGMAGMFDQILIVIPSLDMVIVRMGLPHELLGDPYGEIKMRRPKWEHRFFQMLLAGVVDQDVPIPGDWLPDPDNDDPDWYHLIAPDLLGLDF